MRVDGRGGVPGWALTLAIIGLLVFLDGAYVGTMQLIIGISEPSEDPETRDLVYLYLHAGFLVIAAILGFMLGRWLNGMGLAISVLAVAALAVSMVLLQLTSRELTCSQDIEFLRHWRC